MTYIPRMTRRVKLHMTHCDFVDEVAEQNEVSQSIIIQAMIDSYMRNNVDLDNINDYVSNFKAQYPDTYPDHK